MKIAPHITLWILIFALCQPLPVCSQHAFTLMDLACLADKLSENIKIAEDDLYIARMQKKKTISALIPRVSAYSEATEYKDDDQASPDTMIVGIKLNHSFTLNGKEFIACDMAEQSIQSKEFLLESTRSQFLLQVAQSYYNILKAGDALDIAVSDVERLTGHRNAVRKGLDAGKMTKTSLYRAQAELSKSITEKVRAQNSVLQSRSVLRNLVDLNEDFKLATSSYSQFETYSTTLDEIITFALKNRAEIKSARKELDITRRNISYEKSNYWPLFSVEAGYRETDIRYDASPTDVKYDTEDYYITGQLSFKLFDAGHRKAVVRQALADWRKAKNNLSLIEKQIILESQTSFLDYQSARSTMENLADEVKSAKENYKAVRMQLTYGMADSIDMMDANTLLVTAHRRISDARYSYIFSVLKMMHARGDLFSFLLNEE